MSTVNVKQAEGPLIVSIDIGTSSIRVALFDRLGRAIEGVQARRTHEFRTNAQGASEADPDFSSGSHLSMPGPGHGPDR